MRGYVFECRVVLSNTTLFLDQTRLRLAGYYEIMIDHGTGKTFVFIDGYATTGAVDGGLRMRVGATNLVSSHAIRTAFEKSILDVFPSAPEKIAWYSVGQGQPVTI
ncbi:hypothetical protein SAMCCGM7_pC0923 (plasmid) [Sinorhizobium americanum CCGM7]|uniref:SMa0974 family conjugal transfer regulator n=1 Tax=Sinorhizobium americanum TaxID=194963 RepID=UPI0004DA2533|nr:hypothetical protein [Sinorhizobium americanum]APG88119.1 hypothetical protein SAMCCGM7_pC0923 [Sinorhizobium americanum CCGM7]